MAHLGLLNNKETIRLTICAHECGESVTGALPVTSSAFLHD